ncbi:MAG: hypothetical protein LUH56_02980 [Oscillospiraceae bacterium]|nr:hypothetical protein [Oscillospiraceae bacterium]
MKTGKKLLAIVLTLVLCIGMISQTTVMVSAASTFTNSTTSAFYYYTLSNVGTGGYLTYGSSGFTVSKSCTKNSQNFAFMGNSSKKIMLCESDSVKYVGASSIKEGSKVTNSSAITYWVVLSVSGGVIIKPYANQNLALTASSSGVTLQKFSSKNKNQIWNLSYVKTTSDSVSISGNLSSTTIDYGNALSISSGTITSSLTILSSIKVSVLNSSGKEVASKTITPSSGKTYSLSSCVNTLSSQIKSLATGTYTIKVTATNANNKTATWSKSFTIKLTTAKINDYMQTYYDIALKNSKKSSFSGYCGTCVAYQLSALGITTKVINRNGNELYDYYKNLSKTTGGYKVTAYAASKYNIKTLLTNLNNEVSYTDNSYLMLGFQTGSDSANGQQYGHALLIYRIADGYVYYTESFGSTNTLCKTIAQFSSYYSSMSYEGAILFSK